MTICILELMNLEIKISIFFDETLKPLSDKYFGALKDYLEIIRGDLSDSIENQNLDQQAQTNLSQRIFNLKEDIELHKQNLESLKLIYK